MTVADLQRRIASLERRLKRLERSSSATPDRHVGTDEVCEMLGVSRATLWRRERAGTLPPSFRDGGKRFWSLSAIVEHQRKVSGQ